MRQTATHTVVKRRKNESDAARGVHERGELFAVVVAGVVHEANVYSRRTDVGEAAELLGNPVGLGERIEWMFVLHDDVEGPFGQRIACLYCPLC